MAMAESGPEMDLGQFPSSLSGQHLSLGLAFGSNQTFVSTHGAGFGHPVLSCPVEPAVTTLHH